MINGVLGMNCHNSLNSFIYVAIYMNVNGSFVWKPSQVDLCDKEQGKTTLNENEKTNYVNKDLVIGQPKGRVT